MASFQEMGGRQGSLYCEKIEVVENLTFNESSFRLILCIFLNFLVLLIFIFF